MNEGIVAAALGRDPGDLSSLEDSSTLGPLINAKQVGTVEDLVSDAVSRGASVAVGGESIAVLEARFADLQEGAKVKAFYEERGAKLVATRLEVLTAPS